MTKHNKYTKESLQNAANNSVSVAQMFRSFGLKESGGNYSHFKKLIKKFDIDTSHFLGIRTNSGEGHKGGCKKREWQEILVIKKSNDEVYNREKTIILRRALIESGRKYVCEICGLLPSWNGKELRLQIDHINTDGLDNRPENLRFLYPNCHSQTENWCRKNGPSGLTSRADYYRKRNLEKKRAQVGEQADPLGLEPNFLYGSASSTLALGKSDSPISLNDKCVG